MHRVSQVHVILADISEWNAMNGEWVSFFPQCQPAQTAFPSTGLPLGARVEVDCIAAAETGAK